jgi:nicotinate-nucleotide pyrophosphorylase
MAMRDVMDDPRAMAAVKAALTEDVGEGDATTLALVDPAARANGEILAREACRVAGGTVARAVLACVDPALAWRSLCRTARRSNPAARS